jgi:3-isopropylmalate dehydratase small subunit
MEIIKNGRVWLFGDDVDTDHITPSRFSMLKDYDEMSMHCFEDIRPEFGKERRDGDIVVAGKNFGCGSSRQRAPLVIQRRGIACVIAESYARIFLRNSVNMGFPVFELPDASKLIREGDLLSVDSDAGIVRNETKNEEYRISPMPEFLKGIYDAGGLDGYIVERLRREPVPDSMKGKNV